MGEGGNLTKKLTPSTYTSFRATLLPSQGVLPKFRLLRVWFLFQRCLSEAKLRVISTGMKASMSYLYLGFAKDKTILIVVIIKH